MTYQNFWTMTTNTPHVFKGNCSGIIKINEGNQINDIMCHGKNGNNYWYTALSELIKGEMELQLLVSRLFLLKVPLKN